MVAARTLTGASASVAPPPGGRSLPTSADNRSGCTRRAAAPRGTGPGLRRIRALAQWEREATAERTSAALQVLKQQGRATGGVAPYGFQFIAGRREWHQGEQETLAAIIAGRRAGLSWAKVADKPSGSVKGAQGPDLGDSHTVTNRNRAPPRSRSTGPRHVRRNVGAYVLASLLHSQVPVATNQPSSRYCVW